MFENDVTFNGKHATYMKYLVNEAKIFERYIDVYMNAAIWGLLYGRNSTVDSSDDRARIYADAFANERSNCIFLYRLVMLLENSKDLSSEARIDRAFRVDTLKDKEEELKMNLLLFHNYIRGGIELLYERFALDCITKSDYLDRTFEVIENFQKEMEGISYEKEFIKFVKS